MPPGRHIETGGHIGGGQQDYAWLIWDAGWMSEPGVRWLTRQPSRWDVLRYLCAGKGNALGDAEGPADRG
jgi:hypothetical protein